MVRYDYYTGEPDNGSPPISQQEIVNNANMMYNTQGMYYNPGMMGYNGYGGVSSGCSPNFMNPPQYGYGFAGDPISRYMQSLGQTQFIPSQPQQKVYEDYSYYVPGYNTGSRYLMDGDLEEKIIELQNQMIVELEKANAEREAKNRSYYSSLGMEYNNYYGMPIANSNYADPNIVSKYKAKLEEIKKEGEERRTSLNKRLSRLVHNNLDDGYTDEDIDKIYSGHLVTVSAAQAEFQDQQEKYANATPFDNSGYYRNHFEQVSSQYERIFDQNDDLNTFLKKCGQLIMEDNLAEEDNNRRDMTSQFKQDGSYRRILRKRIQERYAKDHGGDMSGIKLPPLTPGEQSQLNNGQLNNGQLNNNSGIDPRMFPTLSQSARLLDDGSLEITAPSWLGNNNKYCVNNTLADEYEQNRLRFIESIYNNDARPGSPPSIRGSNDSGGGNNG